MSAPCTVTHGDVTLSDEHDAFLWVDPTGYAGLPMSDEQRGTLRDAFAATGR